MEEENFWIRRWTRNVKHGERETNVCDHRADESKEQSEGTIDVSPVMKR